MWQSLFALLGKVADAVSSIWGRRRPQPPLEEPVDAERARAGTVAGGSQYTAGRQAGRGNNQ